MTWKDLLHACTRTHSLSDLEGFITDMHWCVYIYIYVLKCLTSFIEVKKIKVAGITNADLGLALHPHTLLP